MCYTDKTKQQKILEKVTNKCYTSKTRQDKKSEQNKKYKGMDI